MASGLALDHAAWSSPWRLRSLRDKGVLSGSLLIAAISLPPFPGGASVAAISAALLLGPIGVGVVRLLRILWLPMASIVIGVATVAVSLSWDGGLNAQITAPGLAMAAALAVRALAATLAMFTLACSTPMVDLFAALRKARVPGALVEIAALVYRFTFSLLESVGAIHHAQEARLGYINRKAAMRSASMGVAVLFTRTWDQARRLEDGLAGRGYEDALRTLEPDRLRSGVFLLSSVAVVAAVVGTSLLWGYST